MKLMLGQLNPTMGDLPGNVAAMLDTLEQAKTQQANIVVFTEMSVSGYPCYDLFEDETFIEACLKANEALIQASNESLMVIWGNLARNSGPVGPKLNNVVHVAVGGQLVKTIHKHHLPNYDIFREPRYFAPGPFTDTPLADMTVTHLGKTILVCICADLWSHPALTVGDPLVSIFHPLQFTNNPLEQILNTPCDLLVNLSASPYTQQKPQARRTLLNTITQAQGCPVVYANQVGANDELLFDGHSVVAWPDGTQAVAKGFEADTPCIDLDQPQASLPATATNENNLLALYEALAMGLRDYVRKTGFDRVMVGLSGGIDSALTATLAVHALGPEHVHGVLMPGPYSSQGSIDDAQALAQNLGIQTSIHPITVSFASVLDALGQTAAIQDLAEQNLQSRLRGLLLMSLSNRYNHLVLATGNKSEFATGYSTLYGDSCGALAPIGDLFKTEVYALANWINEAAGRPLIPDATLSKPPSAELAPNQLDTDTLPPYDTLDGILKAVMIDHRSLEECQRLGYDRGTVEWVWSRYHRAEYKRQQTPFILKVSAKAFGSGRVMPIAQRGFDTQLGISAPVS